MGKEEARARDLFYACWIPDLFMKRVMENGSWSLFCPDEACELGPDGKGVKTLQDSYGEEFEELYLKMEANPGKAKKVVTAQSVWFKILESQMETGTPYMCYKDAANKKSNQKNIGTIRCSNLCTEIMQFTSPDEIAVCNLASLALPRFVEDVSAATDGGGGGAVGSTSTAYGGKVFNFARLQEVTKVATLNLNRVIDCNFYPVKQAEVSNFKHRPIGLGVQGLADVFMLMKLPFESEEARLLNKQIFETIYYAAVERSVELAEKEGHYETFPGSPASEGKLQFDLWNVKPDNGLNLNWDLLKSRVIKHGLRNSLLVAPMPTASTAQILGNNESIEPYTQNIYVRRVLSGEFIQVNRHMLRDLVARGLWNADLKQNLIAHNGSLANIPNIPNDLKELYKTVWEIKQKISSMHFYGWKLGLKTGQYYLRTKAAVEAIKFTVDNTVTVDNTAAATKKMAAEQEEKAKYECVGCR